MHSYSNQRKSGRKSLDACYIYGLIPRVMLWRILLLVIQKMQNQGVRRDPRSPFRATAPLQLLIQSTSLSSLAHFEQPELKHGNQVPYASSQ